MKKVIALIIVIVIGFVVFVFIKKDNNEFKDTIKYDGKC